MVPVWLRKIVEVLTGASPQRRRGPSRDRVADRGCAVSIRRAGAARAADGSGPSIIVVMNSEAIADLLRRCRSGDERAAGELFARYARSLTRIAEQHLSRKLAG